MICYKDKTFCSYWETCLMGLNCDRALTEQVKKEAEVWWEKKNPPIVRYLGAPPCYIKVSEK